MGLVANTVGRHVETPYYCQQPNVDTIRDDAQAEQLTLYASTQ